MNADGSPADGMGSVVAEQQPMGRKQMLQSVAATGLGAILFGAQARPSFAADVDYAKVRCARAGTGMARLELLALWLCPRMQRNAAILTL